MTPPYRFFSKGGDSRPCVTDADDARKPVRPRALDPGSFRSQLAFNTFTNDYLYQTEHMDGVDFADIRDPTQERIEG